MSAGPADKALDTFKGLVFDELVKLLISRVLGMAGWLAWGPVAFIVTKVITWVAEALYDALKEAVNFQVIILKNAAHQRAFAKATMELQSIADTAGINSPEFKVSREAHKNALAKFVRYGATA